MQTQAILQASYLDIVFDNRNKQYGSYELRTHYQRRMTTAIMGVIAACCLFAASTLIKKQAHATADPVVYREIEITRIEPPTIKPPIVTPPPAAELPKTHTAKLTPPVIKPDELVKPEDLAADKKQLENAVSGNDTKLGFTDGAIDGTLKDLKTKPGVVTPPAETKPLIFVEQMPEFIGDMNEYLSKSLSYPAMARENNVQGKVMVQFVVNEDGSVSNAKVLRGIGSGCDAEALRVVNSMPKWKPGKQNGKAVKVYYTLPIRFVLN